jgi:hypothetical protein
MLVKWPECRGSHDTPAHRPQATNRKVAGSIPDGAIGFFKLHNPSG